MEADEGFYFTFAAMFQTGLRTHTCGELTMKEAGKEVILCGWVQRSRDLGGMTFVDLRDRYGITQLVFNMDTNAALCEAARKLSRENVIQAKGKVTERQSKNPKQAVINRRENVLRPRIWPKNEPT